MTDKEMLIAILSYDANELADAFAPLKESERKALYPALSDYLKRGVKPGYFPNLADRFCDDYKWLAPHAENGKGLFAWNRDLALLALGSIADARKFGMGGFNDTSWPAMIKVLEDRRPEWADAWLEHLLKTNTGRVSASWTPMRELIIRGVCRKPSGDGYFFEMAGGLPGLNWGRETRDGDESPAISGYLRRNPDLLEDVYTLFAVETVGFLEGKDQWKESGHRETWAQALRRLSDEGLLDRGRLLRASLEGLARDFKPLALAGLASFHEGMAPTEQELIAIQSEYCRLLSAETESAASFGIKMLKKVEQAKGLDDAAYVDAAVAVFDRKGKGMAKAALEQLKKIGRRTPALAPAILAAAADRGLAHGDTDVQEASLALLEGWGDSLDENLRAAIAERVGELAATLQERARAMGGAHSQAAQDAGSPPARKVREKVERSVALEVASVWRELAGVNAALSAMEAGAMPPPLTFDLKEVPVLTGTRPVSPVASLDELVDLVAQCIEGRTKALDLERILDGISRLDTAESKDFPRLAAPLAVRLPERRGGMLGLLKFWLRGDSAAICAEANPFFEQLGMGKSIEDFQRERTREIGQRLERGTHVPMLCLPTHEGGWISAATLVERLLAWERRGLAPEKFDYIQALLRLAPEGRGEAARGLDLSNEAWARVIRWTLTGKGGADDGDDPDIWLAAARSRDPRARIAVAGMDGDGIAGPDGSISADYSWMTEAETAESDAAAKKAREAAVQKLQETFAQQAGAHEAGGQWDPSPQQVEMMLKLMRQEVAMGRSRLHAPLEQHFDMRITPAWIPGCGDGARPTVLLHDFPCPGPYHRKESLDVEWAALSWPHNLDAFFASGLVDISTTYDMRTSKLWPEYAYLTPLFDPDRPVSMPAAMLICLGLCAPQGDLSRTAIDVLAECIEDGRAHPDTFDEPVARIALTRWFQYGRFTANMGEVARVSPLHAWVVAIVLERHVARWEELPKNGHHVLELLVELLAQLGLGLGEGAREALGKVNAGGKSGKLVKQLLGIAAQENGVMDGVREAMLTARVARAERWADKL